PTGRTFTIVGNVCPLTRITTNTEVPLRIPSALDNETPKPVVTLIYSRKPRKSQTNVPVSKSKVVQIVLWYLDSGCMCARYQARPTKKHLHAFKRIFRYLKGTVNQGLWYPKDSSIALIAFADADHDGCQDTRCSTFGSMQFLRDRLVRWSSKRSKHIDIRFHFIKEQVENGVVELYFVNTEYQLADIFTKALCRERIEFLINKLGMRSFTLETLKQLADEAEE
ncbi:hypothetical protein Tco_1159847, partial [Tanacetum coccineum]